MSTPPVDETERLRQLAAYDILDTPPERELDEIVALASAICETPIALVSLLDETRQWFKAKVGIDAAGTPRSLAFCAHAIAGAGDGLFTVTDARRDPRFADNPLVVGDPNVVFYAGAPLVVEGGAKIGTLCVIDHTPRTLTPVQEQTLLTLSRVVVRHLELRRALVSRAAAERQLARIFELSVDLMGAATPDGYFRRVNPAFERTFGWTAAELCARPINDFVHPDDVAATDAQRAGIAAGGSLSKFEQRFRARDGTYRWLSWSAVHENGTHYFVARDVTDEQVALASRAKLFDEARAARDVAEKANRSMDEFLATVSHELRTPLNAMLGWTRLLRSDAVPESGRPKVLETIERNATVQAQLIEDLLDVSRIISGKMRLDVVSVDLVRVIEAALDVVRPAAEAKGVILRPLLDPCAGHVIGDGARLQQVVWNLLANAVKFTPRGGSVDVRLACVASSVEITVSDTGQGIKADFLEHVFERFRQADGATTRAYGGLGLGLAIVKTIAELHGGSVRVESAGVGLGATFTVQLPLASLRSGSVSQSASPPHGPERDVPFECPAILEGLEILVVDDEKDARELMAAILSQCKATVRTASSVEEALAMLDRAVPAVLISDIGMPGED
ncbi:MAG TPA: ATP-binding protein, partial [Labilithrix sp.]|nr:ATP-binding protein [Labilithrix sp.]